MGCPVLYKEILDMQYKNFYIQLPVRANNSPMLDGIVQNDTANIVHIQLMDGDKPFDFDGFTDIVLTVLLPTLDAQGKNVKITARISNLDDYSKENPYSIQAIDPEVGRIDFALTGALTQEEGQYFAQIEILDGAKSITTTKFNYRVKDTLSSNTPMDTLITAEQFSGITDLINQLAAIVANIGSWNIAEDNRKNSELERKSNEIIRIETFQELANQLESMMSTIRADLAKAEEYAKYCYEYSKYASAPSEEAIRRVIAGMDIPSRTEVDEAIERESKSNKTLGDFGDSAMIYKIRQGLEDLIPMLSSGEFGLTTDKKDVYIGTASGNKCLTKYFEAGTTPPSDTNLLFIDTANNNAIKFFNKETEKWEPTATSVFA